MENLQLINREIRLYSFKSLIYAYLGNKSYFLFVQILQKQRTCIEMCLPSGIRKPVLLPYSRVIVLLVLKQTKTRCKHEITQVRCSYFYFTRSISSSTDTSCCSPVVIFFNVIFCWAISFSPAKATNAMPLALA